MANRRMYLLHRPSGHYVYISKRMGWGWYGLNTDSIELINEIFRKVEEGEVLGDQDDFVIAMEGDSRLLYKIDKNKTTKDKRKKVK